MSLAEEYKRQFAWRDWGAALAACPIEPGQKVLDFGCGPGDLSAELVSRGAQVVGVDSNEDLLSIAQKRGLRNCAFLNQDLKSPRLEMNSFDGIWCSFTAAYFTNFEGVFRSWIPLLRPKSWVCITEIDDLLGHEPMLEHLRAKLDKFYDEAFTGRGYDFRSGHKISAILKNEGFKIQERLLRDQELAFDGPAIPAVTQAWSNRFNRMGGLKNFLGDEFEDFRSNFLKILENKDHRSTCRVFCVVGMRP